jgi:hypothetical protein
LLSRWISDILTEWVTCGLARFGSQSWCCMMGPHQVVVAGTWGSAKLSRSQIEMIYLALCVCGWVSMIFLFVVCWSVIQTST